MQNLDKIKDFLENPKITQTKVFAELKCEEDQAKILKYFLSLFLKGEEEPNARNAIKEVFKVSGVDALNYLDHFGTLLDLGYLEFDSFLSRNIENEKIVLLELLNSTLKLGQNFFEILSKKYEKPNTNNKLLRELKTHFEALKAPIESLFKEHHLNQKEQVLFLSILREEYNGDNEKDTRDLNSLLNLISANNSERIKNRALLDESGRLVAKGLLDYDEWGGFGGGFSRTYFIPESTLKNLSAQKGKLTQKSRLESALKSQDIFTHLKPKIPLSKIILNKETKEILDSILSQMNSNVLANLVQWGLREKNAALCAKIIFYGAAGTGKTLTALGLAKALKRPVLSLDCSKILGMYVGESEKNVRAIFENYKEIAKKSKSEPILLLDEADQFLSARSTNPASSTDKMHNQMQNIFLEQIEKFDGVLVATTNLLENIDPAFSRRFNYKVEFKKPDFAQRVALWERHLPRNAPFSADFSVQKLAQFPLSGGQIALVVKNTAFAIAAQKHPNFTTQSFIKYIERELNSNFDGEKTAGFRS